MLQQFENEDCKVSIKKGDSDYDIVIEGVINFEVADNIVYYLAAAPPDYRFSFSGSGMPFASQVQAFEKTPNVGKTQITNGKFEIKLIMPNAYYVGLGTVYISPRVFLQVKSKDGEYKHVNVILSDGIPYRSLTYPGAGQKTRARANVMFYDSQFELPVRSQEQILMDSSYPTKNVMNNNFWGMKPPM